MSKNRPVRLTMQQLNKAILSQVDKPLSKNRVDLNRNNKKQKATRPPVNQTPKVLIDLNHYTTQYSQPYDVPSNFKSSRASASLIVPVQDKDDMHEFAKEFDPNILPDFELVFVDDNCSTDQKSAILQSFSKSVKGQIISSSISQGWNAACLIGAHYAHGEILVFIDPSLKIKNNCLKPMTRLLLKEDVQVVGPLLKYDDNTVEGGLEWDWTDGKFLSRGQECYQGIRLNNAFVLGNIPEDMQNATSVEAISGKCVAIRKKDFLELGGFCPHLKTSMWAVEDFCLAVRERNKQVICQGNSVIETTRSPELNKKPEREGKSIFFNKWVYPSRIDPLVNKKTIEPTSVRRVLIRIQNTIDKVFIATSLATALKNKHKCEIIFNTNHPEVLFDNPFIDKVISNSELSDRICQFYINLDLAAEYRPGNHILSTYADVAGVSVEDCEPYIHTSGVNVPESYGVINFDHLPGAGMNWENHLIQELIDKLDHTIVCIGEGTSELKNVVDLRNELNLYESAYVLKNAKFFIGTASLHAHLAQHFKIKGVCLFGSQVPETILSKDTSLKIAVANNLECIGCQVRQHLPLIRTECLTKLENCMSKINIDAIIKAVSA